METDDTAHYMMADVLKALAAKCHAWLPGPAGSGKSTLGRQCGTVLGYSDPEPNEPFETAMRIHMTGAIETPFQLTGYRSPNGDPATLMTPFRKAWQFGGLFIFDDVDRSNPKALAAFNEALANGHCAFPDGVVKAHETFLCIATANTFGLGGGTDYVGAARLDKATLDRFVYFEIPYDVRQEKAIARGLDSERGPEWCAFVQKVRAACKSLGLKHLVTPRSTYKGLRLLAAGLERDKVETATVYAGLDSETLARVKGAL
jgi:MoxR-like ATPase